MEQYDVYSSRSGLSDTAVSIPRGHTKFKRDKSDFTNNEPKISAAKLPRQSVINDESLIHQTDSNAMSVLPRLLRTMANGTGRETNSSLMSTAASGHLLNEIAAGTSNGLHNPNGLVPAANDTDSTSSSSSFNSTPSSASSSSIISFLTPGQLGPVAAMAAALNVPNSTSSSILENPESSGLVTLATASSMFEKEWLARTGFAGENGANGHHLGVTISNAEAAQVQGDLITLTVEHGMDQNSDGSSPILFRTITSTSPISQINGSTPVTRAMLNVQSLAAFLRETQKQQSTPSTQVDLPVSSGTVSLSSQNNINSGPDVNRIPSPVHQLASPGPSTFLTVGLSGHPTTPGVNPEPGHSEASVEVDNMDPGSLQQQTAFFSLQPAPGSLLSSSDLQQLMASGEFMTSAARKTLLGQSPDGATRQLYLLVPSDCPVIMSRSNQSSTNLPPSPVLNSVPSNAPILEAISPGVEQDENCSQLPPAISSAMSPQPMSVALPQVAGAVLAPNSSASTALSTLIAGFEVRNQVTQQPRYSSVDVSSTSASSWTCPNTATVLTTDSSRIRLPISLPGLSLSDHNTLTTDRPVYPSLQNNNVNNLLGAVKSDPDMYTPNGHPYTSLIEDVNRFRPYSAYQQPADSHELAVGANRNNTLTAGSTTNAAFFQSDIPVSILLPQSGHNSTSGRGASNNNPVMNSSGNTSNPSGTGDLQIGAHLIAASPSLSRVNTSFSSGALSSSVASGGSLLPTNTKMVNTTLDECRRTMNSSLLAPGSNGRGDAASTTYLEHLNPDSKDIRRRVSHNEVERRRRDRINTWISELYKLLPPDEQAKSQYQSKGIVLKRVCEYFQNVDNMLKAANAAVEQTRVENGLLRQRNRELQQENQLLSASLHLGAAAAAAHLKNRQPRVNTLQASSEELNGTPGNTPHLKESSEPSDYPAAVTVFAVNPNLDYGRATDFSQANSTCLIPTQSIPSSNFSALSNPSNSSSNVFTIHTRSSATAVSPSTMISPVIPPLTLPSLDLVANHTDNHPE